MCAQQARGYAGAGLETRGRRWDCFSCVERVERKSFGLTWRGSLAEGLELEGFGDDGEALNVDEDEVLKVLEQRRESRGRGRCAGGRGFERREHLGSEASQTSLARVSGRDDARARGILLSLGFS